jgi:DNA polymerase-3 subunit epsilon
MKLTRPFIVFDAETTGPDPVNDRIVQIAARKFNEDFTPLGNPIVKLINPGLNEKGEQILIPAEAIAVHGITNEMVKDMPTFSQYAKAIFVFFQGCDLAGFNIGDFDVILLCEEFSRCNYDWPELSAKIIDAMRIFKFKEKRDLTAAAKFYCDIDFSESAHDAGRDVDMTAHVLLSQLKLYEDLSEMDAKELDKFCFEQQRVDVAGKIIFNAEGVPVYAFGKHKGQPVASQYGYAKWMIGEKTTPSHTKKVLRGIFNNKI